MAGGMNKRGGFGSMAERVARSRGEQALGPAAPPSPPPPPGLKHCWVHGRHGRLPGLLLEWRQVGEGWRGRVMHPVHEDGAWVLVEEWLDAGLLGPAE